MIATFLAEEYRQRDRVIDAEDVAHCHRHAERVGDVGRPVVLAQLPIVESGGGFAPYAPRYGPAGVR